MRLFVVANMLADLLAVVTAAPPPPTTTVYLMRHCARSTYLPDLYGGQEPEYLANYSDGGELPDWGVAPTLCTHRGSRIVQGEGASLKKEVLSRMGPQKELKVIYDAGSRRDNTTALDFLEGVGLPFVKRDGDAEIFTPTWAGCPELTPAAKEAAVSAQLAAVSKPHDYEARVAALQELLGEGIANFTTMPDVVSGGPVGLIGGSFVASSWIEAMLLQQGAGLPMGYGRVTPDMLYEMLELHVYYRAVADKPFAIEQRGQSNLLAHMLKDLQVADGGVSLYVGHDTNLDGISVMLSLSWPHAPPYPANTTVPGSMLRLTTSGVGDAATVQAAFIYPKTFTNDDGDVAEVEALFANGKSTMPLAELASLANSRIDPRCVRLSRWWDESVVEEQEGVPTQAMA